jgi:hypothetical protein
LEFCVYFKTGLRGINSMQSDPNLINLISLSQGILCLICGVFDALQLILDHTLKLSLGSLDYLIAAYISVCHNEILFALEHSFFFSTVLAQNIFEESPS